MQGLFYVLCVGMAAVSLGAGKGSDHGFVAMVGWLAVALIAVPVLALPNYAVLARRLHDGGFSAFWMLLLLPNIAGQMALFGAIGPISRQVPEMGLQAVANPHLIEQALIAQAGGLGLVVVVPWICSLILFVMTMLPGKSGPNRFGQDPRDPTARPDTGGTATAYDDARLEALFAEAKRANARAEPPYSASAAASGAPVDWSPTQGGAPAPVFGRRGI